MRECNGLRYGLILSNIQSNWFAMSSDAWRARSVLQFNFKCSLMSSFSLESPNLMKSLHILWIFIYVFISFRMFPFSKGPLTTTTIRHIPHIYVKLYVKWGMYVVADCCRPYLKSLNPQSMCILHMDIVITQLFGLLSK